MKFQKKVSVILIKLVYFIIDGIVSLKEENDITITKYNNGTYFGEIEVIKKTYRDYSVITQTNCEICSLKKYFVYNELATKFNEVFKEIIRDMIKRLSFYNKSLINIKNQVNIGLNVLKDSKKLISLNSEIEEIKSLYYNNYIKFLYYLGGLYLIKQSEINGDNINIDISAKDFSKISDSENNNNSNLSNQEFDEMSDKLNKNLNDNNYLDYKKKKRLSKTLIEIQDENEQINKGYDNNDNNEKSANNLAYSGFIKKLSKVNLAKIKERVNNPYGNKSKMNLNILSNILSNNSIINIERHSSFYQNNKYNLNLKQEERNIKDEFNELDEGENNENKNIKIKKFIDKINSQNEILEELFMNLAKNKKESDDSNNDNISQNSFNQDFILVEKEENSSYKSKMDYS